MQGLPETTQLWLGLVRKTLASIKRCSEKDILLSSKRKDQARLLNWRVWCIRYAVPLPFLMEGLLNRFAFLARPGQGRFIGLGIPITSLTGARAQAILEELVLKQYPAGENFDLRRSSQQARMAEIGSSVKLSPSGSRESMLAEYRDKIDQRRKRYTSAKHRFSRRPWRGNPWR